MFKSLLGIFLFICLAQADPHHSQRCLTDKGCSLSRCCVKEYGKSYGHCKPIKYYGDQCHTSLPPKCYADEDCAFGECCIKSKRQNAPTGYCKKSRRCDSQLDPRLNPQFKQCHSYDDCNSDFTCCVREPGSTTGYCKSKLLYASKCLQADYNTKCYSYNECGQEECCVLDYGSSEGYCKPKHQHATECIKAPQHDTCYDSEDCSLGYCCLRDTEEEIGYCKPSLYNALKCLIYKLKNRDSKCYVNEDCNYGNCCVKKPGYRAGRCKSIEHSEPYCAKEEPETYRSDLKRCYSPDDCGFINCCAREVGHSEAYCQPAALYGHLCMEKVSHTPVNSYHEPIPEPEYGFKVPVPEPESPPEPEPKYGFKVPFPEPESPAEPEPSFLRRSIAEPGIQAFRRRLGRRIRG